MDQQLAKLLDKLSITDQSVKEESFKLPQRLIEVRASRPQFGTFDHILVFRAGCKGSSGHDPNATDIVAGLSDVAEFSLGDLKTWVQLHARKENQLPTPWISVTADPLRAFNYALHLQSEGQEDVYIAVIDTWVVGAVNMIPCNRLRKLVGEEENTLFQTEVLVWQRIPSNAIIARWSWKTIDATLGRVFSPLVDLSCLKSYKDGKRPLEELRDSLKSLIPKPTMSDLARVLVDDLGLHHWDLTTKQIAMIMIGWSKGLSTVNRYVDLQWMLERSISQDLDELDYRLYVRTCRWYQDCSVTFMPEGTEDDLEHMKRKMSISRNFILPTFDEWHAERLNLERAAYVDECGLGSPKSNFIPLMKLGLEIQSLTILRSVRGSRVMFRRTTST